MFSIIIALIFNAIDYVTGLIGAIKEKTVNSTKLRDGLFKKIGFILCYFLAFLIDTQGHVVGINLEFHVLPFVIAYVVVTEIVSICENISIINPDIIPEKLLNLLHIKGRIKKMSKIDSFVSFLEKIANDDSHGYAQDNRYGPDYDCSSFVAAGLIHAGFSVSKYSTTRTLAEQLLDNGFKSIDVSAPRKRGDIFLNTGVHVVTCTDSENIVHASINEYGGIVNGQTGDQTGKEICIIPFSSLGMKFDKHFRYSDNFVTISDNAFPVGSVCELLYNLNVRTGPSTQYRKKNHDELTKDGQKHDKNCNGSLDKGTEVSILATVSDADGNLWAQIPSGWICAREGGENYLKCL